MTIIQTLILSLVEGITEFLPISSTAHLEFTARLMGIAQDDFVSSFIIIIQSGAIMAIVWLYRRKIFLSREAFLRILVGFIPTGIIGFLLYTIIKKFLLGNFFIAAMVLILGGFVLLAVEHWISIKQPVMKRVNSIEDLSYRDMIYLGIIQSLAVVPGVSRSGSLIVGGLLMKIPRVVIIETAFLLAIPTMIAAAGYDMIKTGIIFTSHQWLIIGLGTIVSGFVAYITARWLLDYVRKTSFAIFGWYRIIAGLILIIVGYFFLI